MVVYDPHDPLKLFYDGETYTIQNKVVSTVDTPRFV